MPIPTRRNNRWSLPSTSNIRVAPIPIVVSRFLSPHPDSRRAPSLPLFGVFRRLSFSLTPCPPTVTVRPIPREFAPRPDKEAAEWGAGISANTGNNKKRIEQQTAI